MNIIKLSKKHIAPAGTMLGKVFMDGPISVHVIPDFNERKLKMKCGIL